MKYFTRGAVPLALLVLLVLPALAAPAYAQGTEAFIDSPTNTVQKPSATPDPFTDSTTFQYNITQDTYLSAGVYATDGRLLRRLVPTADSSALPGGTTNRRLVWNALDDTGNTVPAGVAYDVRFAAGLPFTLSQTIISPAGPQPAGLTDIDVDTGGNIYVVAQFSGSLIKYAANGTTLWNRKIPGTSVGNLNRPTGVAVNYFATHVYVADVDPADTTKARVQKFSAIDGSYAGEVRTGIGTGNALPAVGGLMIRFRNGAETLYVARPGEREFYRSIVTGGTLGAFVDLNVSKTGWNAADQPWDASTTKGPGSDSNVFVILGRNANLTTGLIAQYTWAAFNASGALTASRAGRHGRGVAWSRLGEDVVFTDFGATSVFKKALGLPFADEATFSGNGEDTPLTPWGVAIDNRTDSIYVACHGHGQIIVWTGAAGAWTTTAAAVRRIDPPAGALLYPTDIAVDAAGRLYVANHLGANVNIYNADGTFNASFGVPGELPGELNKPYGIAVDTAGYIYVTSALDEEAADPTTDDRIQVYEGLGAGQTLGRYTGKFANVGGAFRGLHLAPATRVGATTFASELLAVTGGDAATAANRTVYRYPTQEAWTVGTSRAALGSSAIGVPLGDVTRDFFGRVYVNANDLSRLIPHTANLSNKTLYVRTSTLAADTTLQTAGPGALGGVAVDPYSGLFLSNMRDPNDATLGNNLVQTYHLTRIGGTSRADNGGRPFSEFVRNAMGRPGPLVYRPASTPGGIDRLFMIDVDSQVIRIFEVDHGEATTNLLDVDIVSVTRATDTLAVTSAAIDGANVNTVLGTRYVRAGGPDTITVTFSKNVNVNETPTVKLRDVNANEVTVTTVSYAGNQYVGTVASLPGGLVDGRVRITVRDAWGSGGGPGIGETLTPNPTDTDAFSFFLDVTPPNILHVTQPASPTSEASISSVTGSAEDAIGLYRVRVFNFDSTANFVSFDTVTVTNEAWGAVENWTATSLALRPPSGGQPSKNYITAVAFDKALNPSNHSDSPVPNFDGARRLVERQDLDAGNANVTPDRTYTIGARQRFVIRYNAQQALSSDSIQFTVPSGWTLPQTASATSAGFTRLGADSSGFTGLALKPNTGDTGVIEVSFASATTGGYFTVIYGDSATSNTGRVLVNDGSAAGPVATLGANDFTAALYDNGETRFAIAASTPPPPDLQIEVGGETTEAESAATSRVPGGETVAFPGEANVEVLSVTLYNRNNASSGKTVRVVSVALRVMETGPANPANASKFFSFLGIGRTTSADKGYYGSVSGGNVPASPNVTINLNNNPFDIAPGGSLNFRVWVDLSGNAPGDSRPFRLEISAETSFVARVEADGSNKAIPTKALTGFAFPFRHDSVIVRGLAAPDTIQIDTSSNANITASAEEQNVRPWNIRLVSPVAQRAMTTTRLAFRVTNAAGAGIVPNSVISSVSLRDAGSGTNYLTDNTIEGTGETITLDIPTSPNPLNVGGNQPETRDIQVLVTIASTAGDSTFRLQLTETAAASWRVFDLVPEPDVEVTNKRTVDPRVLPFGSGLVTTQRKARVRVQAVRITDLSNVDVDTVTQGAVFRVHVGLRAEAGRADARIQSADTDLRFFWTRDGGAGETEVTSEFTISSRSHTSSTLLAAGGQDTITYDVVQGAPFSGGDDSIQVRLRTADSMPFVIDQNAFQNGNPVNRVVPIYDASRDSATNVEEYASASVVAVPNATPAAGAETVHVLRFRITDNSAGDTLTAVRVVNTRPATNGSYDAVRVFLDANKNDALDAADTQFGTAGVFSTDTITFTGSEFLRGNGETFTVFVVARLETSPLVDGDTLDARLPVGGLSFAGRADIPSGGLNSSGDVVVTIVADRLAVTPETTTASVGASQTMNLEATDPYGNRDRVAHFSGSEVRVTITEDTPNRSVDITATTLASPSPAPASGDPRDTIVTGNLVQGAATVTFTDTQAETVTVAVVRPAGGLVGDTSWVGWTNNASVTANARTGRPVNPDSQNVVVLDFLVTNPGLDAPGSETVTRIVVRSENTTNTAAARVQLWRDLDLDGVLDATDTNIDTQVFDAAGVCTFSISIPEETGVRFLVSFDIETRVADGDSLGARIGSGGVRLAVAGDLPATGEVDSIEPDDRNDSIDVDATHTGGTLRFSCPAEVNVNTDFEMTLFAEDRFGNVDRERGAIRTSTHDIDLASGGSVVTFQTTSLTQVSGWPGTSPRGRVRTGADTISARSATAGNVTITATDIASGPPADTSCSVRFLGNEWELTARPLQDLQSVRADSQDVVIGHVRLRNIGAVRDTVTRVFVRHTGTVCETDILNVRLFFDSDLTQTFTAGDTRFGAATTFGTGTETAVFDGTFGIAAGESRSIFVVVDIAPSITCSLNADTLTIRFDTFAFRFSLSDDTLPLSSPLAAQDSRTLVIPTVGIAPDTSKIAATQAVADGVDTALVVVTARDTAGVAVTGTVVQLFSSKGSADTLVGLGSNGQPLAGNPDTATTNETGIARFWVRSASAAVSSITARVGGVLVNDTARIYWIPAGESGLEGRFGFDAVLGVLMTETNPGGGNFVLFPTFRPDGGAVAWLAKRADSIDTWAIYVSRDPGGNNWTPPIRVTGLGHYVHSMSRPAWWGADTIIFSGWNYDITTNNATKNLDLWAVNADGSDSTKDNLTTRRLVPTGTDFTQHFLDPTVIPGTDTIVFSFAGGLRMLNAQNPNGTFIGPLTATSGWGVVFTQPTARDTATVAAVGTFNSGPSAWTASKIYVFKRFNEAGLFTYNASLDSSWFVQTSDDASRFKWAPSWDSAGEVLSYAEDRTGNFNLLTFTNAASQRNPQTNFATTNFDIRARTFLRIANSETFASVAVNLIPSTDRDDLAFAFPRAGEARVAHVTENPTNDTVELKVLSIDGQATIDQTGGVVYQNSRLTVVVETGAVLSGSLQLRVTQPSSPPASPGGSDSIILTGAARQLFPEGQRFADSITVILYYDQADLDAAGIVNGSADEYRLRAFWWNGSAWTEVGGVVDPTDQAGGIRGRIEFQTDHFSIFAPGLPAGGSLGTIEVDGPAALFVGETGTFVVRVASPLLGTPFLVSITARAADSPAVLPLVGDTAVLVWIPAETGAKRITVDSFTGEAKVAVVASPFAETALPAGAAVGLYRMANRISVAETSFGFVAYLPGVAETPSARLVGADSVARPADETRAGDVFVWDAVPGAALGDSAARVGRTVTLRIDADGYTGQTSRLSVPVRVFPAPARSATIRAWTAVGGQGFGAPTVDGSLEVEIPAGAWPDPIIVTAGEVEAAGGLPDGHRHLDGAPVLDIVGRSILDDAVETFAVPVVLRFAPPAGANLERVRVGRLSGGVWEALETTAETTTVSTARDHLSIYTLLLFGQTLAPNLSAVVAYPNPWRPDVPTAGLAPSDNRFGVKLDGLTASVRVRIFSVAGDLVVDATVNTLTGASTSPHLRGVANGQVSWDLRNTAGRDVASGVYIVQIESLSGSGDRAIRKVAVIR